MLCLILRYQIEYLYLVIFIGGVIIIIIKKKTGSTRPALFVLHYCYYLETSHISCIIDFNTTEGIHMNNNSKYD